MIGKNQTPEDVLMHYFGHAAFRQGQRELISALLSGRDVLGVMPTGAGKSICYQVPAMMMPGTALVISPLISLMKDQVAALTQSGISAAYINSSMSREEYEDTLQYAAWGEYKILYVAPERLNAPGFKRVCGKMQVPFIAVDEAHCVSQWGQDFRPSYLKIAEFIASFPERPIVGAFTATATEQVKKDIIDLLVLRSPVKVTTGFDRPNLRFRVIRADNKIAEVKKYLLAHPDQSGIVYCATRKGVEAVCDHLRKYGYSAVRYHAGLEDKERRENQEAFVYDRAQVMVATNAFGMGIDKSNVSFVIHYNMPQSLEAYYQEAGRAGRDGSPANCILLYSNADIQTAKYLILHSEDNDELTSEQKEKVLQQNLQRLNQMAAYCKTEKCLRKTLRNYFGETAPDECGNCGNCCAQKKQADITLEAQKILSAVARAERKFGYGLGVTLIVRMLHGSKEQRVFQLGLDQLPTYGIMRDTHRKMIRAYIDHLVDEDYLRLDASEYPVLRTTERSREVLFEGAKVWMEQRQDLPKEKEKRKKITSSSSQSDLFEALRAERTGLAAQEHMPAYIILSNASLMDMAIKRPHTREELLRVSGVGEYKAKKYGDAFLKAIIAWEKSNG